VGVARLVLHVQVNVVGWSANVDGTLDAKNLSGDHLGFEAATVVQRNLICFELLVLGFAELVLLLKIDP